MKQHNSAIKKWIFIGIPVLFGFGFIMSYLYEWLNYSNIVAIFAPVNESIWEHFKIPYFPMLLWWILGYLILSRKHDICLSL